MSIIDQKIHDPLDHTNRPRCTDCDFEMWLMSIQVVHLGLEMRTYECARCAGSQTLLAHPADLKTSGSPSIAPASATGDAKVSILTEAEPKSS